MRLYFLLAALQVLTIVHCGTDFSKPPFKNYGKTIGHNYVRLGLGYTLPVSNDNKLKSVDDLFHAIMQGQSVYLYCRHE